MPGRWSPEPGELQYTDQLFQHLHTQRGLARVGVLDLDRDVFAAWRKPVAIRLLRIVDALDQHRVESAGRRLYRFATLDAEAVSPQFVLVEEREVALLPQLADVVRSPEEKRPLDRTTGKARVRPPAKSEESREG